MPDLGSVVRLTNGMVGVVTNVSPDGRDDRVEVRITAHDILAVLEEATVEDDPYNDRTQVEMARDLWEASNAHSRPDNP